MRRAGFAIAVLAVVLLPLPARAMGADVVMSPKSTDKGGTISVKAMHFFGDENVLINWDAPAVKLAQIKTDAAGSFQTEFQVPADAHPGVHRVVFAGDQGSAVVGTVTVGAARPSVAPEDVGGSQTDDGTDLTTLLLAGVLALIAGFGIGRATGSKAANK